MQNTWRYNSHQQFRHKEKESTSLTTFAFAKTDIILKEPFERKKRKEKKEKEGGEQSKNPPSICPFPSVTMCAKRPHLTPPPL
jgi:hypothetical protein